MRVIEAVKWSPAGDAVRIIDQRELPGAFVELDLREVREICDAIKSLAVRGAPAIGICGSLGLVAAIAPHVGEPVSAFRTRVESTALAIRTARPTAVNLPWAIDRMRRVAGANPGENRALLAALRHEATAILREDREMCRRIGEHGVPLLFDGARVLTHCNAGALATGGIGTALAPIYLAAANGLGIEVWAGETRPLMQGSRLTAWELSRAGVPVTIITDGMAASLMRERRVDCCIVGADRIAANGDVANKIGTYGLAVLARHHSIPFYVAAPSSTFDAATPTGAQIEIEQRHPDELRRPFGLALAPRDAAVHNPAFDVTPHELVSAIISDCGVHYPPYDFSSGVLR